MSGLRAALGVEWLKAVRSRVPWGISAGLSIAPLVCGLFMVILKDPDAARRLGLLGTKAQLAAGTADWPTMLSMLSQAIAIAGGDQTSLSSGMTLKSPVTIAGISSALISRMRLRSRSIQRSL